MRKYNKEQHTDIINAMIAELSFRDKAATVRDLYQVVSPKTEPSGKEVAGLSKVLAKECKHIVLTNCWNVQLFYVKDSQIENKEFSDIEELYFLHNMEQIARQRLLAKKKQKSYTMGKPLVEFLKNLPPWDINALKEYQAKRIELSKQCLTKIPISKASKNTSQDTQPPESAV